MLLYLSARSILARGSSVCRTYIDISGYVRRERLLKACRPRICFLNRLRRASQSRSFHWSTTRLSKDEPSQLPEFLEAYKKSFEFPGATKRIKHLKRTDIGEEVVLHGYLGSRTDLSKNFGFVPLIDKTLRHSVQIISSQSNPQHEKLKSLREHTPVAIRATVKARKPGQMNLRDIIQLEHVEVEPVEIYPLNEFPEDIIMKSDTRFPAEQRHLQIRNEKSIRDALRFRDRAISLCREVLQKNHNFMEVDTPLLFKSTPEGAREFLVPTRAKGFAYALPQSPQQYKQILMASGIPRYFQYARCFRDEDHRADRQPEFAQLDLEMSFAKGEDIMRVIEQVICRLWNQLLDFELPQHFPRMTYQDAMARYGSDKPDLRLGMEISRVEDMLPTDLISKITPLDDPIVEAIKLTISDIPKDTMRFVFQFMDSPEAAPFLTNPDGQPGIFVLDSSKPVSGLHALGFEAAEALENLLQLKDGDLLVLQARKRAPFTGGSTPLGNLRLTLHKAAVASDLIPAPKEFEFLWITDFPLFSPTNDTDPGQGGSAGLSSTHHPFTAPKSIEDVDKLLKHPLGVKGEHYDIVVNGVELGGGSRRIHDAKVQEFILRDVLKMSNERLQDFKHLLEVLRAGCPPHAGIALGFDRLVAVMMGKDSIRDVIAFPKSGKGEDLLVKSPSGMTPEQLNTYHLQLKD